jgi:NAD(P)-dependent dehydrogenase (short-subunit alcohol dehydrogenase family)
MYDFKGKVALVTGAARRNGFGRAIALRFAMEGADVVAHGRYRPPEQFPEEEKEAGWKGLESVVEEIRAQDVRGLAVTADISDRQQVQEMVDKVLVEFGRIDFLVANAGVINRAPVIELTEEDWHRVIATNLDGVFYCCQAVARHMVARGSGGAIVNISSLAGKTGIADISAYATSKFGVNGLTQVLAMELGPHNIRVNAISPGRFLTDMGKRAETVELSRREGIDLTEAVKIVHADVLPSVPLGRLGNPEELASAVMFLCSEEASFITGQSINVNGGRLTAH